MDAVENVEASQAEKKKKTNFEHVPGRSAFPVARVQKILKADTELGGIAKEAVFLVSRATERFIARVSEAARSQAGRERRTTVQKKDILMVTKREDEYFFLGDTLKDRKDGKLDFSKQKKGEESAEEMDDESLRASGPIDKDKGKDTGSDEDEGGQEFGGEDETRSEGVSLPPSSRPSTPLSLGDDNSEHFEPLEDDIEEDR